MLGHQVYNQRAKEGLRCFGHVEEMERDKLIKRVYKSWMEDRKSRGHPRNSKEEEGKKKRDF